VTKAEARLWIYLRTLREQGIHFRRQHAIGPYVTDFCAPSKRVVIELDGSQHQDQKEHNEERTTYLNSLGYKVIRFWNAQVMNDIQGVIRTIEKELEGK
jgi:very-short-patch-repair endonuclease